MVDHFAAFLNVGQLSTTEHDRDNDLIFVLQKAARLRYLKGDIVLARFGTNANFLRLGVMNVSFGEFLLLLVLELAEVHDAAHRGPLIGSNFHQIQICVPRLGQSFVGADDSEQRSIGADYPNRRNSNLLVNPLRAFDKP
jgi:hypothetical protein